MQHALEALTNTVEFVLYIYASICIYKIYFYELHVHMQYAQYKMEDLKFSRHTKVFLMTGFTFVARILSSDYYVFDRLKNGKKETKTQPRFTLEQP